MTGIQLKAAIVFGISSMILASGCIEVPIDEQALQEQPEGLTPPEGQMPPTDPYDPSQTLPLGLNIKLGGLISAALIESGSEAIEIDAHTLLDDGSKGAYLASATRTKASSWQMTLPPLAEFVELAVSISAPESSAGPSEESKRFFRIHLFPPKQAADQLVYINEMSELSVRLTEKILSGANPPELQRAILLGQQRASALLGRQNIFTRAFEPKIARADNLALKIFLRANFRLALNQEVNSQSFLDYFLADAEDGILDGREDAIPLKAFDDFSDLEPYKAPRFISWQYQELMKTVIEQDELNVPADLRNLPNMHVNFQRSMEEPDMGASLDETGEINWVNFTPDIEASLIYEESSEQRPCLGPYQIKRYDEKNRLSSLGEKLVFSVPEDWKIFQDSSCGAIWENGDRLIINENSSESESFYVQPLNAMHEGLELTQLKEESEALVINQPLLALLPTYQNRTVANGIAFAMTDSALSQQERIYEQVSVLSEQSLEANTCYRAAIYLTCQGGFCYDKAIYPEALTIAKIFMAAPILDKGSFNTYTDETCSTPANEISIIPGDEAVDLFFMYVPEEPNGAVPDRAYISASYKDSLGPLGDILQNISLSH